MRSTPACLTLLAVLVGACTTAGPPRVDADTRFVQDEVVRIQTLDEQPLTYLVDRPVVDALVPIVLVVDGSGCAGQLRPGFGNLYRPSTESPLAYARVRVEKRGVAHDTPHGMPCTEAFSKGYAMDLRVSDHLRALQHLRHTAAWWNGEVLLWGWSDGGDIAVRLLAYYPAITRAVLGAMGGGITMAEQFETLWVCPEANFEGDGDAHAACVADLRAQFDAMRDSPTWRETWSGEANAWRAWASRLDARQSILLRDVTTPFLIVHGAEDFDATPVASARSLVDDLKASGSAAFTYWEIPGMAHSPSSLPEAQGKAVQRAMLYWLLGFPIPEGGPPDFGG